MMKSVETSRDHIEQNARLIDKQDIEEGLASLSLGEPQTSYQHLNLSGLRG
jgi:hypothetical protein